MSILSNIAPGPVQTLGAVAPHSPPELPSGPGHLSLSQVFLPSGGRRNAAVSPRIRNSLKALPRPGPQAWLRNVSPQAAEDAYLNRAIFVVSRLKEPGSVWVTATMTCTCNRPWRRFRKRAAQKNHNALKSPRDVPS